MSECKLDHSTEDVQKKLSEQEEYLPREIFNDFQAFLAKKLPQKTLNEAFHLLKKYDLASNEEQANRNSKIKALLNESVL